MGLQAHPCNNKRTFEGLEEPAGRAQHPHYQQEHNAARSAKQQCTIRVGLEAPDYLTGATTTNTTLPSCTETWYRDQQQQQHQDYDSYVNGFNAAEARASTPFSAAASSSPSASTAATYVQHVETVSATEYAFVSSNGSEVYSNQNIYQNLASMVPPVESLSDRFERVCSSPRPYVQDQGYPYGGAPSGGTTAAGANAPLAHDAKADERYWTFGYSSNCPKKSSSYGPKSYGYSDSGFKSTSGYQQIQRDENGKSYLELGAKTTFQPEWRSMWSAPVSNPSQQQQQPQYNSSPAVKSCTKCGHVLSNSSQHQRSPPVPAQPCYRHQRLSVLSLSMLKLNRYRQCSDPSLHRSVLICNTLRHIEDEMEREGLVCNPSSESSSNATTAAAAASAPSSCDTCCCSHCGTVLSNNSASPAPVPAPKNLETSGSSGISSGRNGAAAYEIHPPDPNFNSAAVANADEDDSGFGDEDSRDIDWSSVFSMSTASGFDISSNVNNSGSNSATSPSSTLSSTYLCSETNTSDPSLFVSESSDMLSESGSSSWKSSSSSSSLWTANGDATDFTGARWKNDLGDELEGFVHILVGS